MKVMIDNNGRIELGDELQKQLGLKPGDEVEIETRGKEGIIKPANSGQGLCQEGNVLVHRGISTESVEHVMEKVRNEKLRKLSEGKSI
jgi:bifunctional DNA-binding transcriptional regulator/antitoxin component of YhaV-PrlF toxin-antitoxin module